MFRDPFNVICIYNGLFKWPFSLIVKGDVGHITLDPDTWPIIPGSVEDMTIAIQLLPMLVAISSSMNLAVAAFHSTRFHANI